MHDKLISYQQAMEICGFRSRTTIYERIRRNKFPRPVKLGHGPKAAVRFYESEVLAWRDALPRQCY